MPLETLRRRLPEDVGERVVFALDCANESRLGEGQVALETARDRLRYTAIEAPIAGTVTQRNINPGEVVVPGVTATVEGHVVSPERVPSTGARILLVSAEKSGQRQEVTTDGAGQFRANLASGGWLVYVHDASGRPVFSRRVDVQESRTQQVTLVDR